MATSGPKVSRDDNVPKGGRTKGRNPPIMLQLAANPEPRIVVEVGFRVHRLLATTVLYDTYFIQRTPDMLRVKFNLYIHVHTVHTYDTILIHTDVVLDMRTYI